MGLTDLFRPKYRHSDAAKRADAVRQMGADEVELVARIARDDRDPAVRRIAIDKIEDPALVADIAASERDRALRDHTRARAAELWATQAINASAPADAEDAIAGLLRMGEQRALADVAARAVSPAVRETALGELEEPRALADVARNASAPMATRKAALARIDDGDTLRAVAVDELRKDIALAALERIEDVEILDAVAAKAKAKAVRVRARKRLAELAAPAGTAPAEAAATDTVPEDKRRHAERVQLLRRAEKLARGSEWTASAAEVAEIERQWEALGVPDEREQGERFARACQRYHARREAHLHAAAEQRARREPAAARPPENVGQAAAEIAVAAANQPAAPAAIGAEAAGEHGERDDAAPETTEAPATEASVPVAAAEAGGEDARDPQEDAARSEAERERAERRARDLATLGQLVQDLERLSDATKRKQVDRTLQRADKAFKELALPQNDAARAESARYHAARQAAVIKAKELREAEEWERWANVPRQEALIAKAEAMLTDENDRDLGERLKALQTEWKTIGPAPQNKSRELWDRFKAACDGIYERVKVARSRATEEMMANLARKEALCERVEALAESSDWDKTAEEIKQLQREWREIGPVPRKRSDAVWKRFRAACDRFFERRKPHLDEMLAERTQNLERKLALCEEAEQLAESTDWKETGLQLRDMQRAWRDIGPVPRKDMNAVNKRFRAACDRFFERRDEHRNAERRAQERAIDALRAELRALLEGESVSEAEPQASGSVGDAASGSPVEPQESLGEADPESSPDQTSAQPAQSPAERILRARQALRELSLTGEQEQELYALASEVARKLLEEQPGAFAGTELDPATSRQRKQKLCARAEELAPAPQTTPSTTEAQTPEAMAERLRQALAKNALSSSLAASTDGRNIVDTIAELESSWWHLGPVPGPEGEALEARFRSACARARQSVGQRQG